MSAPVSHPAPSVATIRSATVSAAPAIGARKKWRRPRILMVTPELNGSSFLGRNGYHAPKAKAGGLADISTLLVDALADRGIDVHVTMPHFRNISPTSDKSLSRRLHLCPDREFFYRRSVYDGNAEANRRAALAFQREVIHHVLPRVRPDIVHCHDWMTALVPAAAKSMGIKSLFTIHNVHDEKTTLAEIEDRGIDAVGFWQNLHFDRYPSSYEESHSWNPVSLMPSAVHSADYVNTVSESFLHELMDGRHPAGWGMCDSLRAKHHYGSACGIVNAPDPACTPDSDPFLIRRYDAAGHRAAKAANKLQLQRSLGLEEDAEAPVLFWPSRLDPVQKGCQLLTEILYKVVSVYWALGLQVVFVADGPFKEHVERIADFHGLRQRIGIRNFDEASSRLAYAGSDFVLMPSAYEPCGLSQMVAMKYGSLPIVHCTGGLKDTVRHLNSDSGSGNGFVFNNWDSNGLRWAIDEAMRYYIRPSAEREHQTERVMRESQTEFSPEATVARYVEIYEKLANRTMGQG